MIGELDPSVRRVTVVGGGISGLLAAYYLDQAGYEVHLYESQSRLGGLIETRETPYGISESAAHSLLATPTALELFNSLNVELVGVRPESRAKFILRDGAMRRFPLRFWEVPELMARALFARSSGVSSDLTLDQWAQRHLGKAALNYLISPFVTGIYGALPSEISVAAAFPSLLVPEGRSLVLSRALAKFLPAPESRRELAATETKPARAQMVAPKPGMGAFVNALEEKMRARLGSRLYLGKAFSFSEASSRANLGNVVICTPAFGAAQILRSESHELAEALDRIRYTSLVSCTLLLDEKSFPAGRKPQGVGVLIPANEGRKCLGVLFNSSAFEGRVSEVFAPPTRAVSLTMMVGGSLYPSIIEMDNTTLLNTIRSELKSLFGVDAPPLHVEIWRHKNAIPQYSYHLTQVWECARRTWCAQKGNVLFGNYAGQVSLRGMIESAKNLGRISEIQSDMT